MSRPRRPAKPSPAREPRAAAPRRGRAAHREAPRPAVRRSGASGDPIGVAMIGTRFMGRAHSNAWRGVASFFDLPCQLRMVAVAGRDARTTAEFAQRWGWGRATTDWRAMLDDPAIGLVDVATPNGLHAEQSIAALRAGRHVVCEKPLAGTIDDARAMRDAAREARRRGLHAFVWFNYRRCPAVAFAHRLVREGRLGRLFHVRAAYLQEWGGPATPMSWRFDAAQAGSGAHGDLNAHIVDMARFVSGEEVVEVVGALTETFIPARPLPPEAGVARGRRGNARRAAARSGGGRRRTPPMGRSTVDDCALFLARMSGGAVASFEATRLATGNQNRNGIEINGENGSLRFDFERMNELLWWDNTLPAAERGWSRILCTTPGAHPYVEAYWPPAHLIGYEHGFTSQAADMIRVVAGADPVVPLPDFEDAWRTQCVLEAALQAARTRGPVPVRFE